MKFFMTHPVDIMLSNEFLKISFVYTQVVEVLHCKLRQVKDTLSTLYFANINFGEHKFLRISRAEKFGHFANI